MNNVVLLLTMAGAAARGDRIDDLPHLPVDSGLNRPDQGEIPTMNVPP
jgi:hypothetical protein